MKFLKAAIVLVALGGTWVEGSLSKPALEQNGDGNGSFWTDIAEVEEKGGEMTDAGHQDKSVWLTQGKGASSNPKTTTLDESNKKLANTTNGAMDQSASIQSFQGRASNTVNMLQNEFIQAQLGGSKEEIVNAAADTLRGTSSLLEEAQVESEAVVLHLQEQLAGQEHSGWAAHLISVFQSATAQVSKALEILPVMTNYLEDASKELHEKESKEQLSHDRNLQQVDTDKDNVTSSCPASEGNKEDEELLAKLHKHKKEAARHKRKLHRQFSVDPRAKLHLERTEKIHNSIEKGDHVALHQHLSSMSSRFLTRSGGVSRRRLQSDVTLKASQCKLLMDCVGRMSIYDMILYFYSDDIDPNSGEIDDNIFRHATAPDIHEVFNSADVVKARNEYSSLLVPDYISEGYTNPGEWCDNTLQKFYRNVEFDRVPHWEGATVSDVCLAQGSHTYVQLKEIATKISFQSAEEIAKSMFECSKDLYNSVANPRHAPFPFSRAQQKLGFNLATSNVIEDTYSTVDHGHNGKERLFDNDDSQAWIARTGKISYQSRLCNSGSSPLECLYVTNAGHARNVKKTQFTSDRDDWKYYESGTSISGGQVKLEGGYHSGRCLEEHSSENYLVVQPCQHNIYQYWQVVNNNVLQNVGSQRYLSFDWTNGNGNDYDALKTGIHVDWDNKKIEDKYFDSLDAWAGTPIQPDVTFDLKIAAFSMVENVHFRGECLEWSIGDAFALMKDCSGQANQMWMRDSSTMQIKSMLNQEYCLDFFEISGHKYVKANPCDISKDEQKWIQHGTMNGDNGIGIKNVDSGKCLAHSPYLEYCDTHLHKKFLVRDAFFRESVFSGQETQLRVESTPGNCLAWNRSGSGGDRVVSVPCKDDPSNLNHIWKYDAGTKKFINMHNTGKCLGSIGCSSSALPDSTCLKVLSCSNLPQNILQWVPDGENRIKNLGNNGCITVIGQEAGTVGCSTTDPNQKLDTGVAEKKFHVRQLEIKFQDPHICESHERSMWSGGTELSAVWSESVEGGVITHTALLDPATTPPLTEIQYKCASPAARLRIYEIHAYGFPTQTGGLPLIQGATFEDSFIAPSGIDTDYSRNEFGQVSNAAVDLYTYSATLVKDDLEKLLNDIVGTYGKIWDEWLNSQAELSDRFKDPADLTDYEEADAYMGLLRESGDNDVLEKEMVKGHSRHRGVDPDDDDYDFDEEEETWNDFNWEISLKYASIQDGFNLVFGKDASAGYVCGIESAVAAGGVDWFPGSCCLDAPFQNPGGEWGREFDCSMICQEKAPFFNGLSEESCSAVGGTWCPTPTDCTVLKTCVDDEIALAEGENKAAYVAYLEPGNVTDPLDYDSCADSTEYFGFDALYKNYDDICEHIKQLRNTKDFDFLDEVYAQGSPRQSLDRDFSWPSLTEPNTESSQSNMVQDGPWKAGLLYGFGLLRDLIELLLEVVQRKKCPVIVMAGNGENTLCSVVSNIYTTIMGWVVHAMNLAYNAWEFAHGVTCETNNIQPIEDWEILQVQQVNHGKIYDGLQSTHDKLFVNTYGNSQGKLGEILDAVNANCGTSGGNRALMSSAESSVRNAGCDGKDQDEDGIIDNCEEDQFAPWLDVPNNLDLKDHQGIKHVDGKLFSSLDEALATLRGSLTAVDDCAGEEDLSLNLTVKEAKECQAIVSAAPIHWCHGLTNVGHKKQFAVALDTQAPAISCGFQSSSDPDKKILYLEEGDGHFDAGLTLQVNDSCSEKVDVEVTVRNNEFDTTGPSAFLALVRAEGSIADVPELVLNQATCNSPLKRGYCKKSSVGARVYEVVVEAADAAGWSSTDTCHVIVGSKLNKEGRELVQEPSAEELAKIVDQAGVLRRLESIQYEHYL